MSSTKGLLNVLFSVIFLCMLTLTVWASLHENVFVGAMKMMKEPWGVATLADTYFGFLTFFLWVAYREEKLSSKLIWFVLVITLGNMAMAFYVLRELRRIPSGAGLQALFQSKEG